MHWPRIIFLSLLALFLGAFLHYTLPQRDIVRVTDTEIIRTDFSGLNRIFYAQGDSGGANPDSRDLRLINTIAPNGDVRVYRNEDTGFGWPPYFKLDSADLQAEAASLSSAADNPTWVAVTHYGWRSRLLTTYPNAVGMEQVDGPDTALFPWLNIVILLAMALILFMAWRIWERFEDRVLVPIADRSAVRWAKLKDWAAGRG
ncbi:hypothetical protein roselon_01702 [Roseibacterium elongatum DSM 19469]|uniref:DUF1523 domain-containing protein n=1 Tax=Roseicyclus elongatus DSM 19469 TaxID=1294273 RepID=W8RSC6_9RHOB|nr:DUF1523 family protein [Roseibacterium elongatum]AHM04074.1 hypothetical protein roselon_01702 [Roseibacterium elongatum DSM 19469]